MLMAYTKISSASVVCSGMSQEVYVGDIGVGSLKYTESVLQGHC